MSPLASKTTFLFDLDGTLVDSSPVHEWAFLEVLRDQHPALVGEFDYSKMKGRPTRDVFLSLGLPDDSKLPELVSAKQAHYRAAVQRGQVPLFAGTLELLELLSSRRHGLFVATGASRSSAEQALESCGIARFFEGIVTAEDVERGKPDPQTFLRCLERYDLDPVHSVIIEDSLATAIAAQAAGLEVVLVHSNAESSVRVFPDLPALLQELE